MTTYNCHKGHQGHLGVVYEEKHTDIKISRAHQTMAKIADHVCANHKRYEEKPQTASSCTQNLSIVRRLALYLLHPLRNLNYSLFRPDMSRTRHHLPGQTRQTPTSDTDGLDAIARMHEPRSAIAAEVASHGLSRCCRTSVLAQTLRI